jgi:hypothetical protein
MIDQRLAVSLINKLYSNVLSHWKHLGPKLVIGSDISSHATTA